MKTYLKYLPQALLIIVFVYAAVSKIQTFPVYRLQLSKQPVIGHLLPAAAYLLPAAELLTAGLLLYPAARPTGLYTALGLLILFSSYVLLAMTGAFGKIPCSCGGILNHLSWPVHLVFNLLCILTCLIALHMNHKERRSTA